MTEVLAVVPVYMTREEDVEVVVTMVKSLRRTEPDMPCLLVDDGSPAIELVDRLDKLSAKLQFDLHRKDENTGFSRTVNVGLRRALNEGVDAVLVNADIEFIDKGWLRHMVDQQTESGNGLASVVGARLIYPHPELLQHAGIYFSLLTRDFDHIYRYGPHNLPEALHARTCPVTGALQFIRHECLSSVGLYDEAFFLGWEDVDYCLRVFESGRACVYQPNVKAYHHESLFRGRPSPKVKDWQDRSYIYLMQKWGKADFTRFIPQLI